MIVSFKSRALKKFWTKNDASGIRPDWIAKVRIVLSRLDASTEPRMMDGVGFGFHALSGKLSGRFAVTVSRTGEYHLGGGTKTQSRSIWKIIMANKVLRHPDLKPSHPGEMLREIVIPATGKSKIEIATLLGISRQSLYDILSEKQSVTPPMALRLGKLFGDGPDIWIKMQTAHDLWKARRELADTLVGIPTLTAA